MLRTTISQNQQIAILAETRHFLGLSALFEFRDSSGSVVEKSDSVYS